MSTVVEGSVSFAASSRTARETGSAATHSMFGTLIFTSLISSYANPHRAMVWCVVTRCGVTLCTSHSVLPRYAALRFTARFGRTLRRRKINALGGPPQSLEIVILARSLAENMRHEVAVVQ